MYYVDRSQHQPSQYYSEDEIKTYLEQTHLEAFFKIVWMDPTIKEFLDFYKQGAKKDKTAKSQSLKLKILENRMRNLIIAQQHEEEPTIKVENAEKRMTQSPEPKREKGKKNKLYDI